MFTGHYDRFYICLLIALSLLIGACGSSQPDKFAPIVDLNVDVGALQEPKTTYTGRTAIVRRGDNLYSISFVAGFDYRDVAEWNDIDPQAKIYPGQVIKLYPTEGKEFTGYQQAEETSTVQSDTAEVSDVQVETPTQPTKVTQPAVVPVASSAPSQWIWPAQGNIVGKFSKSDRRNGIHIAGNTGSPVKASSDGRVVYSGTGLIGYGRIIIVKHSPQFLSVYAHNSRVVVKEGDSVSQGQKIAEMGSTDTNRVMLHFEIRKNGTPVDPMRYLPKG